MAEIRDGAKTDALLQVGSTLTVDATRGVAWVVQTASGAEPGSPAVVTGTTQTFGPFDDLMSYRVIAYTGIVVTTQSDTAMRFTRPYRQTTNAGQVRGFTIRAGSVLRFEASPGSIASIWESGTFSPIMAYTGDALTIGPFATTRYYRILVSLGSVVGETEWSGGVAPGPTLGTLTLSGTLTQGVAANNVTIAGATPGSAIALSIAGLTVTGNGATRNVTGIPATSGALNATETLTGATNSPRETENIGTVTAASAADYTIASEGDWATVLALPDATLAGKVVEVQPLAGGTAYSRKTISKNPASPLTIRGPLSGAKPNIAGLTINNAGNVVFEDLSDVQDTWTPNPPALVQLQGAIGNITMRRVDCKGGYGGAGSSPRVWENNIDPARPDYSEYAVVLATITGGVVTALELGAVTYVGDQIAPGSTGVALTCVASGGTGFVGTVDVNQAGQLTNPQIVSGGSGYSAALHPATRITIAGHKQMKSYLGYGVQGDGTTAITGHLRIEDCSFADVQNGVKVIPATGGRMTVTGCIFDRFYEDAISLISATQSPASIALTWNRMTRPFGKASDAGNPHCDGIQFGMVNGGSAGNWEDIQIYGNIMWTGLARGGLQSIFLTDTPVGRSYGSAAKLSRVTGNLIVADDSSNGIRITNPRNMLIAHNVAVNWSQSNPPNAAARQISISDAVDVAAQGNIAEGFVGSHLAIDQLALGLNGALIPYGDVFQNPRNGGAGTSADVLAGYVTRGAYASLGAMMPAGYINFTTRTIDFTREPSVWSHSNLTDQDRSTQVSSNWSRVTGGVDILPVTPGNGTQWRYADDNTGTNPSAWSGSNGTMPQGKFVQVRGTTSGEYQTESVFSLSIGGSTRSWSVTTTADASGPYSETFTGTDGVLLSAYKPSAWAKQFGAGDFEIRSNQLGKLNNNSGAVCYLRPSGRRFARADILAGATTVYLMARATSDGSTVSGYGLRWQSATTIRLNRIVGSVVTNMGSPTSGTLTVANFNGLEMRVSEPNGTTTRIEIYQDGNLLATFNDTTGDRRQSGTTGLFYAGGVSNAFACFDNYSDQPV